MFDGIKHIIQSVRKAKFNRRLYEQKNSQCTKNDSFALLLLQFKIRNPCLLPDRLVNENNMGNLMYAALRECQTDEERRKLILQCLEKKANAAEEDRQVVGDFKQGEKFYSEILFV